MSRQALVDNVNHYVKQLNAAVAELDRFDALPENHKYDSEADAQDRLTHFLNAKASDMLEMQGTCPDVLQQEYSIVPVPNSTLGMRRRANWDTKRKTLYTVPI